MRAAVLSEYGRPRPGEFAEPQAAGDGEAVVEVLAAGLNPIDVLTASGTVANLRPPLPSVAGREAVALLDGRRVYVNGAVAPFGAMAERMPVVRERCLPVPDGVSDGMAVAIGIAGTAGWVSLEWRARLQPGETVLVLGASGVVGQIAVQAARLQGAGRVIAAGRSEAGLERARALGADATVSLAGDPDPGALVDSFREAGGGGVDVIVDPIWGAPAVAALQAANPGGRLVQLGHSAAREAALAPAFMRAAMISILGYGSGGVPADVRADAYARMAAHVLDGQLEVDVEALPLEEVETAWARQAQSPNVKLVLVP